MNLVVYGILTSIGNIDFRYIVMVKWSEYMF